MVMVAFALIETASEWVGKCELDFPFVVDQNREFYVSLGLPRSVLIWSAPVLIKYADQVRAGRELLKSGKGDDLHQIGGDFIIDSTGKLVYAFRGSNKDTYDRPSVPDLLAAINSLQGSDKTD